MTLDLDAEMPEREQAVEGVFGVEVIVGPVAVEAAFGAPECVDEIEATLADRCYYGSSGYRTYIGAQNEVWGDDVRLEPTELIDLGDRLVLLADMPMRAQASGVPLAEKYAGVMTLKNGRVIRVDDFLNQTEALEAVGLRE